MTDKITLFIFRVMRPLFAALIGLALVQALEGRPSAPQVGQAPVAIIKIPAA